MNVIILTIFIGLVLVSLFMFLFWYQIQKVQQVVNERDALLPLEEEGKVVTKSANNCVCKKCESIGGNCKKKALKR